jgi:ATPase subunit of ABC transporter with duplicated ATPase domains
MKILTGELGEFDGNINNIGSISLGYLSQIHFDTEDRIVRDDLLLAFREVREAEVALDEAEKYMEEHPEDMEAISRYTEELDRFQMIGGYGVENKLERVAR